MLFRSDVERLTGMRTQLTEMLRLPGFEGGPTAPRRSNRVDANGFAEGTYAFGADRTISISSLREPIADGQTVSGYVIEGSTDGTTWQTLATGTTIGYCKLDRFTPVTVRHARVRITSAVGRVGALTINFY